ncbi:SH3 domain-containing protein [uncultured Helicobacter sp.]|uniref:SH3 domain-containing protein n=1 Tax=uncultured Helicobacter sp. TaxID=175537 RepID=UPI002625B90F|nr:SH3 domain-containing protein [uncultured Helicobacter sp.]
MKIFTRLAFILGLCIYGIAQNTDSESPKDTYAGETRMFPRNTFEEANQNSNPQQAPTNTTLEQKLPNAIIEENLQEESTTEKSTLVPFEDNSTFPLIPQQQQDSPAAQNILESQELDPNLQPTLDKNYSLNPSVKNVYLELLNPPLDILYVHQIISLDLKLLVLSDYSTIKTEFIFENAVQEGSVEILNKEQNWNLNAEDSSLRNTFYLKIKQPNYIIPQIKVSVNTSEGEASESTQNLSGRAIKLERKGNFSQVLAQDLKILDTKITNYDTRHNLAVFQLQSTMGNLFDFHLEAYPQQGIESKSGDYKQAEAFYYAIVPKDLNTIRFDYFNLTTSKYTELQVENIALEERVSTQSDIKPKNNYQFFKITSMIFLVLLFFGLYLYKRKLIFILFGVLALGMLLYFLTLKTSATLKANVSLRIQPTFNSTIILTTQEPMQVEILAQRSNYYKVLLQDERIGWVKRDDLQN